jgi:hypothetical protein
LQANSPASGALRREDEKPEGSRRLMKSGGLVHDSRTEGRARKNQLWISIMNN